MPRVDRVRETVAHLRDIHPNMSAVRFWRVLVTAVVIDFDDHLEGEAREPEQLYEDVMDRLREQ